MSALSGAPMHAQTMAVGDRYSGDVYIQPAYRQAAGAGGQTLSWPGKTATATPQFAAPSPAPGFADQMRAPAYAAQAYRPPSPTYQAPTYQPPSYQAPNNQGQVAQTPDYQPSAYPAQVARGPSSQTRVYGAPPVMPWYQRYGATEAASTAPSPVAPPSGASQPATPQAGAPQSIYDAPAGQAGAAAPPIPASSAAAAAPPPPAPVATAANEGETAHFYSLHRQYGLTPDPDPIPPQFFTQTADLSDPPGPSPVYKATSSSGVATTAVHTVQPDDSTSTPNQP